VGFKNRIFKINKDLNMSVGFAGREGEKWMIVEPEMIENFSELRAGHTMILRCAG
jgi:hypothetical protein